MKDLDNITQSLCYEFVEESSDSRQLGILHKASIQDPSVITELRALLILKTNLHSINPSSAHKFSQDLMQKVKETETQKVMKKPEDELTTDSNTEALIGKLPKDSNTSQPPKETLLGENKENPPPKLKEKSALPKVILNEVEQLSKDSQIVEFLDENISAKDGKNLTDKLSRHSHKIPELRQSLLLKSNLRLLNTNKEDNFAELVMRKVNSPDVTDILFDYLEENVSANDAIILEDSLSLFPENIIDVREQLIFKSMLSSISDRTENSLAPKVLDLIKDKNCIPFPKKKSFTWQPIARVAGVAALICGLTAIGLLYKAPNNISAPPVIVEAPQPIIEAPIEKVPPVIIKKTPIGSFSDVAQSHSGALSLGQTLSHPSKDYNLTLEGGALVSIAAPFELTVISNKIIKVEQGVLTAECPTESSQITIIRDAYKIKDIGTKFDIDASKPETIIEVIEGSVEAIYKNETKPIIAGEAFKLAANPREGKAFYVKTMPKNGKIGADYFINSLSYNVTTTDDLSEPSNLEQAYLIYEGSSIQSVTVDTTTLGITNARTESSEVYTLPTTGQGYSSYLLRTYPVGGDESEVTHAGSITFQAPIIGLIFSSSSLEACEQDLQISHTTDFEEISRGLEADSKGADAFNLSNDRKTLNFSFYTHSTIDDLRIILKN